MRFSIFQEVLTAHSTLILFVMKMVRVRVSRNVNAIVIFARKKLKTKAPETLLAVVQVPTRLHKGDLQRCALRNHSKSIL